MKNLATFKLENILSSDGITEMKIWENNGIYTITTGNNEPNFDLDNYGCEDSEDLMRLAKRSLKRVTEYSKNEVISFIETL